MLGPALAPAALPPSSPVTSLEAEPSLSLPNSLPSMVGRPPTAADVGLSVEVADGTLAYDRTIKLPARHGLPKVWLIDAAARRLWCYRQPQDGQWLSCAERGAADGLAPLMLPEPSIALAASFR